MLARITKAGGHQYLQLVESFRSDSGKVRARVVANPGRLDQIAPKQLDPLINGLNRAVGRAHNTSSEVIQESGLSVGDVLMLHELWQDLGVDKVLKRALRSSRREFDVEALIRAMVFNRLCDPASKLGCLRWLETVAMPSVSNTVTHQHLLRAVDALERRALTRMRDLCGGTGESLFPTAMEVTGKPIGWRIEAWATTQTRLDGCGRSPIHRELHAKVRNWRPKLGKCRAGSGYEWICWQDRGLTRLRPHWDQGRVLHFGLETGCDYTTIVRW